MIKILDYSNGKVKVGKIEDLRRSITTWVDCFNPTKEEIEKISKYSKIPIDVIDENLGDVRLRLDEAANHSLLVYSSPLPNKLIVSSIAMFISKNRNLITFRKEKINAIETVNELLKKKKDHILRSPSELVYIIIENINKDFFLKMEEIEENIDKIENKVFQVPDKESAREIFKIKKNLIYLHKALIANREVISGIEKQYLIKFTKAESYRFRTLYHDVFQLIDEEETFRDITTGVLDLYMTSVSNNLNIVIKKLTAMASFVLIPTLVASIYGMNFQRTSALNMPELYWDYGYFFALGLMILSVIIMFIYFKKKDWI